MASDDTRMSGDNAKSVSMTNSEAGSISSKASKESIGSHKDRIKDEISKLQEEVASVKGENLQDFMSNEDKLVSNSSKNSPKPNVRRTMHRADSGETRSSKLNRVRSMDTIGSKQNNTTGNTADNGSNNNDNNDNNDNNYDNDTNDTNSNNDANQKKNFDLISPHSIHGNTAKVAANLHRRKMIDWDTLPRLGTSILPKHQSFNVVSIPIDGETKQILYTPSYNKNFIPMCIFLSFNMDSKSREAQSHSKKRLTSFGSYIAHYLKSRLYTYQRFPFYQQEPPIDRNYASLEASQDFSEAETIILLWYMQFQRCISQSNSTFFSPDVVQHLLQRKAIARHQTSQHTAIYVPHTGATLMTAKPSTTETIDDIDILLLRPYQESRLGWQLAYDEPNLKVADYPIDVSVWMMDENDTRNVLGSENHKFSSRTTNIVDNREDLIEITDENAGKYLLDCMGRKSGGPRTDEGLSPISNHFSLSPGGESIHSNTPDIYSSDKESPNTTAYPESSKKRMVSRFGRKTGLAHLFKKKHQTGTSSTSGSAATSPTTTASSSLTRQDHHTTDSQGHPVENAWLESYFSRYLSNYKKVHLPTQFLLPKNAQDTPKKASSPAANNQDFWDSRKALLYSKESLQLRLPFADNSIPAVFCPRVWMGLASNKWRNLLREMYRVLIPGGYALASVIDIGILNSFTSDKSAKEFSTTQERDRILDAISLAAIEKGVHIHPTQHLAQAFKDVGFTNIRCSVLSLKTGDCVTDMGCLFEVYSEITLDLLFRKYLPDPTNCPKGTDPATFCRRFIKEHMGKVDDTAGSLKVLYLVAQKPR